MNDMTVTTTKMLVKDIHNKAMLLQGLIERGKNGLLTGGEKKDTSTLFSAILNLASQVSFGLDLLHPEKEDDSPGNRAIYN